MKKSLVTLSFALLLTIPLSMLFLPAVSFMQKPHKGSGPLPGIRTRSQAAHTHAVHTQAIHTQPALFGMGVISTEDDEFGATFTPDGNTCYFTKKTPSTIVSNAMVICVSHYKDGVWSEPEIAPFSGRYKDFSPCISPDGSKLFFISTRTGGQKKRGDTDIWVVTRSGDGWSEPENIGAPVNTPGWELGCSVTDDGTLYYSSTGTSGNADLYCSRLVNGRYQQPDSLGEAINTPYNETDPFIAPDESYILFASQGRPDGLVGPGAGASYPRGDLYISYRKDGKWTPARNLGRPVNSDAEESNPFVSRDGKTFYFTSERNFVSIPMKTRLTHSSLEKGLQGPGSGLGDIYAVSAAILKEGYAGTADPDRAGTGSSTTSTTPAASTTPTTSTPPAASTAPPSPTTPTTPTSPHATSASRSATAGQYPQKDSPDSAVLFAEGVISTRDDEFGGTFTPDGKTCWFSKSIPRFYLDIICFSQYKNGRWQQPEVAPFSGTWRDFDPVLSPDGKKMVFTSNRPVDGKLRPDYDIWIVEKQPDGSWGEPIRADSAINSPYDEHFASIASSGTIYFSSNRPGALGGEGDADFYYSELVNGHYTAAVHLGDSVSTPAYELDCLIAPDESFLLMGAYGRKDGYGNYDIYISRKVNGKWTPSQNLGPKVNSAFRDYSPRISPDGKWLYFTSERDFSAGKKPLSGYKELQEGLHGILNGSGNIYRIRLSALGAGPDRPGIR